MQMPILEELSGRLDDRYILTGEDMTRWSKDWAGRYTYEPAAVVRPGSAQDVSHVLKLANKYLVPIVPVSGNTGLRGGAVANGAIMLSLDRLNAIRKIDAQSRVAVVESGVVLSDLHDAAHAVDLAFPLSFGAKGSAMIGGCLATNAGGSNVVRYGNARDLCLGLDVVLPSGEIMNNLSKLHKDNTGYSLKHLMIGAEGTLGIITAAALKLVPRPRAYATAMVAAASLDNALTLLNRLQEASSGAVEAFEFMSRSYVEAYLDHVPDARAPFQDRYDVNILVEVGATSPRDSEPQADGSLPVVNHLLDCLETAAEEGTVLDAVVAMNEAQRQSMWAMREVAAELAQAPQFVVGNDISLPLDEISAFLARIEPKLKALDPNVGWLTVAHLGDGNLHFPVHPSLCDADLHARIAETVENEAVALGGSFSAEHGIGLSKIPAMVRHKDPAALATMRAIKAALDPNAILNPGKVIPDQNKDLGTSL